MHLRDRHTSTHHSVMILALLAVLLPACGDDAAGPDRASIEGDVDIASDSRSTDGVLGNSLPGYWRPFHSGSPWNTPIAPDARTHPDSDLIIGHMVSRQDRLGFSRSYIPPVWVVDATRIAPVAVRSDVIFDWWDVGRDGWSDVGVPLTREMWPEQTSDGHITIVDPAWGVAWEMSRFEWPEGGPPTCTTFNIWTLRGPGYGNPNEGWRWGTRGGRGAGFPVIAGLLRPEEVEYGEIRHALVFTFTEVRRAEDGSDMFLWPPACRADGEHVGRQYPIEGMLFQLDPAATDADFDDWGLSADARTVARALQTYGMYLGDRGGDMKIQVQLLSKDTSEHRAMWDDRLPGIYRSIERIPTNRLRIVYTGEPTVKD